MTTTPKITFQNNPQPQKVLTQNKLVLCFIKYQRHLKIVFATVLFSFEHLNILYKCGFSSIITYDLFDTTRTF